MYSGLYIAESIHSSLAIYKTLVSMQNIYLCRHLSVSLEIYIPDGDQTVTSSANNLSIICWKGHSCDGSWVSLAVGDELASWEFKQAHNAGGSSYREIFVRAANGHAIELVWLSLVRTALQDSLWICLSQVPICDLSLLTHTQELVIVLWGDIETVETTHSLCLCWDTLFSLQVPAKDGLVSCTSQ